MFCGDDIDGGTVLRSQLNYQIHFQMYFLGDDIDDGTVLAKIPTKFSNRFSNVFGGDDIDGGIVQTCLLNDVETSLV